MKIYSLHTITDGKWCVRLKIRENDNYRYRYESRPDLRALVDTYYNSSPEELAKIILDNVLGCDAVEVGLMCSPGIYMERT